MKTLTIKNREYEVGCAKEVKPNVWSLGLKGKHGAFYMTNFNSKTGLCSKLIPV